MSDLVGGCFGKHREPEVGVDLAVDDEPSVVEAYGGYLIEPFAGDPRDEELLKVAETLVGAAGSGSLP